MGTAVHPVFAAGGLGHGAAPPGAVKHAAACGGVRALELATRALDSTQQVVTWSSDAGLPVSTAVEATGTAMVAVPTCHGL